MANNPGKIFISFLFAFLYFLIGQANSPSADSLIRLGIRTTKTIAWMQLTACFRFHLKNRRLPEISG